LENVNTGLRYCCPTISLIVSACNFGPTGDAGKWIGKWIRLPAIVSGLTGMPIFGLVDAGPWKNKYGEHDGQAQDASENELDQPYEVRTVGIPPRRLGPELL
jgi:hypothetical protein